MERLEVRHLRTLCAIADTDSLRRAAAAQGYSQPALTTQLQRIELYFGEPLFARSSVGVAPTALGAEIVAQARDVPPAWTHWGRAPTVPSRRKAEPCTAPDTDRDVRLLGVIARRQLFYRALHCQRLVRMRASWHTPR